MIMKKIISLIIIVFILSGCDKEIHITQPTILIKTEEPTVLETILISVTEYAEIDGVRQEPDYFAWSILNEDEEVIFSGFENSSSIEWTPDSAGYFIIKVEIGYDNNKSITTLKEIVVLESPQSFQKKLIGKWTGDVEMMSGLEWKIDISFDSIGHYKAKAYDLSDNRYWPIGPFYFGHYEVDNPNGGQMLIEPSEDVPCTKFEIREIKDNKGFGILSVGFEYEVNGQPYQYECNDALEIENLQFLNSGQELSFSLIEMGVYYYDWYLKYNLFKTE
jgi:hypothetical protein